MSQQQSIPELIQCAREAKKWLGADWKKRIECIQALADLRAVAAVGDLAAIVDEKQNDGACRASVVALGQIGSPEAIQALARFLSNPVRQDIYSDAVLVLAEMEDSEGPQVLDQISGNPMVRPALINGLRQEFTKASHLMRPDWERRVMAVNALGILGATEAIDDMVEAMSKHKDASLWQAIIAALTRIGDDRAAKALVAGWQWADFSQEMAIKEALRSMGPDRTDQPLIEGLKHEALTVREIAWNTLVESEIVSRLMARLEDPSPEVHLRARWQLSQLGERVVDDLMAALHHEMDQVRQLVASALVRIGGEAVDPLKPIYAMWEQAPQTPRIASVSPDGSGDFVTVQEAVAGALPGGIIKVAKGEHHLEGSLIIEKPLALVGAGMDNSRIVGEASEILVRFSGSGPFCALDLTFEYTGSELASVVEVSDGEIGFYRCRFTGGSGSDPFESGAVTQAVLASDGDQARGWANVVRAMARIGTLGIGLRLTGGVKGRVSACEAVENERAGIQIENETQLDLDGNYCAGSAVGIVYLGTTGGLARQNRFGKNEAGAIQVTGQARPTLRENECEAPGNFGILVTGDAQPKVQKNSIRGAISGIVYDDSAAGIAQQNDCIGNQRGIHLFGQAQPTLEGNICRDASAGGIAYYERSNGLCRGNQCIGNEFAGIYITHEASPTVEENTCSENTNGGIVVSGSAQPMLRKNRCQRNDGVGIFYQEQAAGTATENELFENKSSGVQVEAQAQPTLEHNNCQKNGAAGLAYFDMAGGSAYQNRCSANGPGIILFAQAEPTLTENTCSGNREEGIVIGGESQAEVVENLCRENNDNGISIAQESSARLYGNRCQSNARHGIQVGDEATPMLEENDCRNNAGSGIFYGDVAAGVAKRNKCISNEQYGIILWGDFTDPDLIDNDCRGNEFGPTHRVRE